MTREEKVRAVLYLQRLEWIAEQEACRCRGEVERHCKQYEAVRDEIHSLAESLQAEIDEMEEMEIPDSEQKE